MASARWLSGSTAESRLTLVLLLPGLAVLATAVLLVLWGDRRVSDGVLAAAIPIAVVALFATHQLLLRLLLRPLRRIAQGLGEEARGADLAGLADVLETHVRVAGERQRMLDSVLASVPGCIYRLEPVQRAPAGASLQVRVALLSDGFEACTGLPRGTLQSPGGFGAMIHPDDRAAAGAALVAHLRSRQPWALEYRIRLPDGEVRWLLDRGVPVCDADGMLLHVDGVLMDISERARELEEARMLRAAVDRSVSEVLLFDPQTLGIAYANAGARDNLGFDPVQRPLTDVVSMGEEELRALLARLTVEQVQPAGDGRVVWQHRRADGTAYRVETTLTAVDSRGTRMLLAVGLDVEERDARERSLRESEERYRLVVQATQEGIWDMDLRTGTAYVSRQAQRIAGVAVLSDGEGEVLGDAESLLEAIRPDDRARVRTLAEAYLARSADGFDCEYRNRTSTGAYRWLRARGSAVWDAAGAPIRLTICLSDVTQRRIAESILRDTVSRLGAVLEHVAEGIVTFDANGQVRSFNPAAERIFGWTQEEILDQPITCVVPAQRATPDEAWDRAYARLQATNEAVGVRRTGDWLPVEIAVTRLVAAGHELYTAVVRDVSERRRTEEELRKARDSAESSLRAKSEFLAVMSHEIRTPLNGVLGMAQLLLESRLSSEQHETVRMIQRSGEALLTIINDVLDFSKIEAGRMQIEAAPFDLRVLIRDVLDLVAPRVRERGIELVLDYRNELPRVVLGDSARVRQVLVNLVGNAVKFTELGHVAVCIDALPGEEGSVRLRIAVEDSGIGIEPQVQKRLFTAFTQADASTTRRFGGTGLGLAISKQLTDLMGGELRLHSVPGAGSVFTLELSFGVVATAEVPVPLESPRVVRLLVPYRRAREVLTRELLTHGCQVQRVLSVDALLAGEPGELLIVDRAVLGEDTARLGERVRQRGQECLLLVAAFADGDRATLLAEGFAGVLPKPVGSDELAVAMNALRRADSPVPVALVDAGTASALRVLVADDNSVNQRVAMRMLERLGCEVLLADDGLAALQAWREEPLDLVLMDVRMPVMDGLEATASIRAEETLRGPSRVPIVGISANSSSEDERQCRAAGMDDFVPKPIKLQGLEKVIAALVGSGSARTARRA